MKVDQSGFIQGTGGVTKQSNTQKTSDTSFADILSKTAGSQGSPLPSNGTPASTLQMNPTSPLSPLFKLGATQDVAAVREQGMSQLDNLLTSLEMYVNALKNDSVSKDRLKPLLEELVNQKDKLVETVSKLPKDDSLRSLVNGALYTVTQEAINFQSYKH